VFENSEASNVAIADVFHTPLPCKSFAHVAFEALNPPEESPELRCIARHPGELLERHRNPN